MSEFQPLLKQISLALGDARGSTARWRQGADARRLAADWLDEHGEPARAAYVRAVLELDLCDDPRQRASLLDESLDLLQRHEVEWLEPWRGKLLDWRWQAGFLMSVSVTLSDFAVIARELFAREPVQFVDLCEDDGAPLSPQSVAALASSESFQFVQYCRIVSGRFDDSGADLAAWLKALANCPYTANLQGLESPPDIVVDSAVMASWKKFCAAPELADLQVLKLRGRELLRDGEASQVDWMGPLLSSTFRHSLRELDMQGWSVTPEQWRRFASAQCFGELRKLTPPMAIQPDWWEELYGSESFPHLSNFQTSSNSLPSFCQSSLAKRIRHLTVVGWDDLDRDVSQDGEYWERLVRHAPPPERLRLKCHNPGIAGFRAMIEQRWLCDLEELTITSDSQYEVYSGETDGIVELLDAGSISPRLRKLTLHEIGNERVLQALLECPSLRSLESLDLRDDYHGRLTRIEGDWPCLRQLQGVVFATNDGIDAFLQWNGLDRLTNLGISFVGPHDQSATVELDSEAVQRLLRSPRLSRLRQVTMGFHQLPEVAASATRLMGNPAVMPHLHSARLYSLYSSLRPHAEGLRERLGPRLDVF
ncbi:MAG: hypothetical protein KDB14_08260 [Planctomycetales bacterium]|nr:hypothetical protein [Planctomycetales bacterium]